MNVAVGEHVPLLQAQQHHGSTASTLRYREARRELEVAGDVATALLETLRGLDIVDESSDVTLPDWVMGRQVSEPGFVPS